MGFFCFCSFYTHCTILAVTDSNIRIYMSTCIITGSMHLGTTIDMTVDCGCFEQFLKSNITTSNNKTVSKLRRTHLFSLKRRFCRVCTLYHFTSLNYFWKESPIFASSNAIPRIDKIMLQTHTLKGQMGVVCLKFKGMKSERAEFQLLWTTLNIWLDCQCKCCLVLCCRHSYRMAKIHWFLVSVSI